MEISKESLEAIFTENAEEQEVDDYCEAVAKEIEVPNKKSGGKKSIRERLQENKALVAEREKHRDVSKKKTRGQEL